MDQPREEASRRDVRRYELARRLMCHQSRTQTISELTRLSRHQLAYLRQRWRVPETIRHRGPAPHTLSAFFRSPQTRSVATSLAVLCRRFDAIPDASCRTNEDIPIELAERLCLVVEVFCGCFPGLEVEFEQLLVLALGLARGDEVAFGRCVACGAALLIDRLSAPRHICPGCQILDAVLVPQPPRARARGPSASS